MGRPLNNLRSGKFGIGLKDDATERVLVSKPSNILKPSPLRSRIECMLTTLVGNAMLNGNLS